MEVEMMKRARRCGAKHISKSKVEKTDGLRPLVEVEMMKKCTPLWHCGAKQISKSTCTKHFSVGPLLEVDCQKRAKGQGL